MSRGSRGMSRGISTAMAGDADAITQALVIEERVGWVVRNA